MKHPHAELMAQYAQDAMTTDKPWELWEFNGFSSGWVPLDSNPSWSRNVQYRRKPKTIRVGNRDLPEPLRVAPADGDGYWPVSVISKSASEMRWNGLEIERTWLRRGLLHSTKEAAEQWRDAFIELAGGEV